MEWVFVEGIEEALELVTVVPDFVECHYVNNPGKYECDPGFKWSQCVMSTVQRSVGSPHDAVECCNAKKIPLRGDDPAPELVLC